MRKFLVGFLSVMAIVALMVTPSFAITNDGNATPADGVAEVNTIAIEVISPTTGFTNDYNTIYFTLGSTHAVANALTFALDSGATYNNASSLRLCSGITAGAVGSIRSATDVTQNAAPSTISNGNATIQYIVGASGLPAGTYYISRTCGVAVAGDVFINLPASMAVTDTPTLDISSTLAAEVADSDAIYGAFQQFVITAANAVGGAVIDVNSDLLLFTGTAVVADTTTTARSQLLSVFGNIAGTITATSFGSANVTFTITGPMDGVSSIQIVNAGTTTQVALFAIGTDVATASVSLTSLLAIGGGVEFLYTIDTTTVKDIRAFSMGATVAPANDIVQGVTIIDSALPIIAGAVNGVIPGLRDHVWGLNGAQYIMAYFRDDAAASFTSAARFENATGGDRNFWILVNDPATGKWTVVASKISLVAGAQVSLSAGPGLPAAVATDVMDLATTAGITLSTTGYSLRVVFDEFNNAQNITVWAGQSIAGVISRAIDVQKSLGFFQ